jgi:hypothetical protein
MRIANASRGASVSAVAHANSVGDSGKGGHGGFSNGFAAARKRAGAWVGAFRRPAGWHSRVYLL